MRLRDLIKMTINNDGTRSLFESVMIPEVVAALKDWIRATGGQHGVLIGGLALCFYARPRMTQDLDVLFMAPSDIPAEVKGFKRSRRGAFQHNRTHVEVEVVSPQTINIPPELAREVFDHAVIRDGIRVADANGITALKLYRLNARDRADIIDLIRTGLVDLSGWNLPLDKIQDFDNLVSMAQAEAA